VVCKFLYVSKNVKNDKEIEVTQSLQHLTQDYIIYSKYKFYTDNYTYDVCAGAHSLFEKCTLQHLRYRYNLTERVSKSAFLEEETTKPG